MKMVLVNSGERHRENPAVCLIVDWQMWKHWGTCYDLCVLIVKWEKEESMAVLGRVDPTTKTSGRASSLSRIKLVGSPGYSPGPLPGWRGDAEQGLNFVIAR